MNARGGSAANRTQLDVVCEPSTAARTAQQRNFERWLVERRSPLDYLPTDPLPMPRAADELHSPSPTIDIACRSSSVPAPSTPARSEARVDDASTPTELLLDAITGDGRAALESLPAAAVYLELCALIRDIGMAPDRDKVHRIATWISADEPAGSGRAETP